jgi:hypothetical protein
MLQWRQWLADSGLPQGFGGYLAPSFCAVRLALSSPSLLFPSVRSSLGIHGPQAHSIEKWSHLRSNPLELSSSLRSKRLTEGYYASLALIFKSGELTQDSAYATKPPVEQCSAVLQYPVNSIQ